MEIKINWKYVQRVFDTKKAELVCVPAAERMKDSRAPVNDAALCVKDGVNLTLALVRTGDRDSSEALCREIVRRFNEFPEEEKK